MLLILHCGKITQKRQITREIIDDMMKERMKVLN